MSKVSNNVSELFSLVEKISEVLNEVGRLHKKVDYLLAEVNEPEAPMDDDEDEPVVVKSLKRTQSVNPFSKK